MENGDRKIKVLWIDDNPDEFSEFLDDAFDAGLDIEVHKTIDAGLKALKDRDKIFEAVILDANCKISDENTEAPQLVALSHAIVGIYARGIDLPWFVYTGGGYEGAEALEYIIPQQYRSWDKKQWYDKPDDADELFEAIKIAVSQREETQIMYQYPEAFEICKSQELLDLLKRMNTIEFERDETVPNSLRCVADDICDFLFKHGIYPAEYTTSNKIKECSLLCAKDSKYILAPIYIQDSLRFLSDYSNAGSHQSNERSTEKPNRIRADIKSGKAKYLNRSAVHSLMNVIQWASNFPVQDQDAMKSYVEYALQLKAVIDKEKEERDKKRINNERK